MSFMMTLPFLPCGTAPAVEMNHDRRPGVAGCLPSGPATATPNANLDRSSRHARRLVDSLDDIVIDAICVGA
jgi:hypothetical protein